MNEETEMQLRLQVLQLALSTIGERRDEVVARAETYLTFVKGSTNG